MEDLVVGLTKSVVEGALTRAQSAAEEATLWTQRDLVFIACEFEMIYSLLHTTAVERVENNLVMTWVRYVRELAYDMEDTIEFVVDPIHLDMEDHKTIWWWRMVPSCMAGAAITLDEAADEIKQIKARVGELSSLYTRYSVISDSGSKPVAEHQPTASNMLTDARDAARRRQGLGDLTHLITNNDNKDPNLQVISVWGAGGDLGTTSIIRKTYRDLEISHNFACRSWVKLTHPFDPEEFVRRFMAQVYRNACKEEGAEVGAYVLTKLEAEQQDLLKEFMKEVNTKTYLVVLENLTDMVDWYSVRMFLRDMKNGSCIIVSSQQLEIATLCVGHSYKTLELRQFSPDHSVYAFIKEGSQVNGDKEEKRPLRNLSVSQESENYSSQQVSSSDRKAVIEEWQQNYPLVGRESQMSELRGYTARARFTNNSQQVISVWGIAGIGKSALVRSLYYDRMLGSKQFNKYSWVDVSHPFNLRDFCGSLLSDFGSQKDPIKECRELLNKHSCLVVIDDLQSEEEWDLIKNALITRTSGSVIIVITTDASVAAYCTNNEAQVLNVKGLETDAALDLFRKEAHRKNPLSPLNHLSHSELDELILKCGGLPRVIVAIAALLRTQTVTLMDTIRSLNLRFIHHLQTNLEYDNLRGLFGWMSTYFRDCPDSLKSYIFYLSIFPRDYIIRRRRLVRRWIAEGYSRDSDEKSAEEQGEEFFSKLLELSIIQNIHQLGTTAFNETRIVSCQLNAFIREYIVSQRMEENLVLELGPSCVLTTQITEHLIILKGWDRDRIVFESIDFSRLRSMTVFGKWEQFFISKSMKLIRVLDLEDSLGLTDEDVEKIVKQLCRLKFLSLRGCSEVHHLPSSLGDLRQLQSLDIRQTSIVTLPVNIGKLEKLQYIRAGATVLASMPPSASSRLPQFGEFRRPVGVQVPREISKLTVLQTLGVVNISASRGEAVMKWLNRLTELRKLGVSGINKNNRKEFMGATFHVRLESLLMRLDKDNQDCLDHISLHWVNLQSLKLHGLQDKLPRSVSHLYKLRKLEVEMDTLKRNDIELLAKLEELCILRLRLKQFEDDKLHFYAEFCGVELATFEKLKILEIACSSGQSLNVTFGSRSMKNLELLKVDCAGASYWFNGLNNLSELKQVLLRGADEEIKAALEKQLLENHPETTPAVKLEQLPRSS